MDTKFVFKIISLSIEPEQDMDVFQRKATLIIALQRLNSYKVHRSNGIDWYISREKFYTFTNTFSSDRNTEAILSILLGPLRVESFMTPIFADELKDPSRTITNASWSIDYADGFKDKELTDIIDDSLKIVLNDHLAEIVSFN